MTQAAWEPVKISANIHAPAIALAHAAGQLWEALLLEEVQATVVRAPAVRAVVIAVEDAKIRVRVDASKAAKLHARKYAQLPAKDLATQLAAVNAIKGAKNHVTKDAKDPVTQLAQDHALLGVHHVPVHAAIHALAVGAIAWGLALD